MSRTVTQSQAADLTAILTLASNGLPATGLAYTDVTAEYRKNGGSFSAKSLTPTSAEITSGSAETYNLVDGQTLLVSVDGGVAQAATFNTADFGDITMATAAEVATVITTDIAGVIAADVGGSVVISANSVGDTSSLQIAGGTSNTELGFDTSQVNGSTFWVEIGAGVYELEFTASELDTLGSFIYKVTGSTIDQYVEVIDVVVASQTVTSVSLDKCVISGHVFGVGGDPMIGASVSAKVLGVPSIIGGLGIADSRATTVTGSNGEFFLELARQAYVEITIPKMNYKRQLTVPNSPSAVLFEIP